MNEALIENWNANVKPGDLVWVPGDLCMGKLKESLKIIERLNGDIVLIPGNHDRCWFGRSAGEMLDKYRRMYLDAGIMQIVNTGAGHPEPIADLGGTLAKISHFPYTGDSHEKGRQDKYSAYRPEDEGGWLIHGHIHNNESMRPQDGRMLNVGVDVWDFTPVHIDTLAAMVAA